VENTTRYSDHSNYISPSDAVIPKFVLNYLKDKLKQNQILFPSLKLERVQPFRKLYIKRSLSPLSPLSANRILLNSAEVESYFESEGFEIVAPHQYSLDDKRKLFSEASHIVGPYSSGFMNVIFCQPNTKILVFMNFQRIYELYLSSLADGFDLNLLAVTGKDIDTKNIHSSYSIPLQKIISGYKDLDKSNER
jgi:capsular polysaccharide biosynthesis protein